MKNNCWEILKLAQEGGHNFQIGEGKTTIFDDEPIIMTKATHFGQLLSELKLCSRSQARKNNWDFEIPVGFNQYVYGKKPPTLISVLRISTGKSL